MAFVYRNCEGVVIPDHFADDCAAGEQGGIRTIALLKESLLSGNTFNPNDTNVWTSGLTSGEIIVIPKTRGTFDGGAPVFTPGYGSEKERLRGYDFVLAVRDPNYQMNGEFWSQVMRFRNYRVAWFTETSGHISEENVMIVPKNPVEEGITTFVDWQVEIKWFQKNISVPFPAIQIKDLFKPNNPKKEM